MGTYTPQDHTIVESIDTKMALLSLPLSSAFAYAKLQHKLIRKKLHLNRCFPQKLSSSSRIYCGSNENSTALDLTNQNIMRRSANYQPPIWDHAYVQSLNSEYGGAPYTGRINDLKDYVRKLLDEEESHIDKLKLIDTLRRLGLEYHFRDEIKTRLEIIAGNGSAIMMTELNATALGFRLLREYGHKVSQEVFNKFKNDEGDLKPVLGEDIDGILSLYEASFLSEKGESILDETGEFATKILKKYEENEGLQYHAMLASHALELPLWRRMPRFEVRWFIDAYERNEARNPLLLEFAKLDFNYVQAIHQEELKYLSRWWTSTNLGHEELSFARDRITDCFVWAISLSCHPDLKQFRTHSTKFIQQITVIDDIFDVYASLDELELFASAIERWEISAMEQLPEYMRQSFLVLYSSIEEMASYIFQKNGVDVISHLRKPWTDLLKCFLQEATWYHTGYTPSLEKYIENGWMSIAGPLVLIYTYFLVSTNVTEEAVECLMEYPGIIKWSSVVFRLLNDLGTSPDELKRGDVAKSIQCYMHETGASETEAREHIKSVIDEAWKEINKQREAARSAFSDTFVEMVMNMARMAQSTYLHGDGFGRQDSETNTYHDIQSILFRHIDV